jgi:hypothetical protein
MSCGATDVITELAAAGLSIAISPNGPVDWLATGRRGEA